MVTQSAPAHGSATPRRRQKKSVVPAFERGNAARVFARRPHAALPVVGGDGKVERAFAVARLPAKRKGAAVEVEQEVELGRDGAERAGEDEGRRNGKRRKRGPEGAEDFFDELERFESAKARIASLASQIVSNPEANLGKLGDLRKMAKSKNRNVTTLVVLTESQLYKDICPAYRIREISEEEASVKVSKEVAALRNFEQGLLRCYSRFVKSAVSLSRWSAGKVRRNGAKDWSDTERRMHKLRRAACSALCEVTRNLLHFNLADEVGSVVAGLTCDRDPAVRSEASEALAEVLGEAHKCAGTSLVARVVVAEYLSKAIVTGKGVAQEETIAPLLEIRFVFFSKFNKSGKKEDKPGKFNRKKRVKLSEKRAEKEAAEAAERERAERLDLERDMREAHAEATPQELYAAKKSLLNATCKACFNVIKAASESALAASDAVAKGDDDQAGNERSRSRSKKPPPALSAALEGVHLVASMLSAELLDAILAALSPILEGDTLPLAIRFRSLAAAYTILAAHAAKQAVDADSFPRDARSMDACLYTAIGEMFGPLSPVSGNEAVCGEALNAVAAAFAGRRMPPVRAAALARRLQVVAAAAAPTHACTVGLLTAAQATLPPQLVECLYPKSAGTGADNEANGDAVDTDGFGEDAGLLQLYDMDTNDPDIASAENSAAWELATLRAHFHPAVRAVAKLCCEGVCGERRPAGHSVSAETVDEFSTESGGFNPPPVSLFHGVRNKAKSAGRRQEALATLLQSLDERYEAEAALSDANALDHFPGSAFVDMWQRGAAR
jgi:nucleolar complex protein 3